MDGTVLVADDDRTIRTVLTQALTRAGCKVHATSSMMTLMRWVDEGKGDLVISDVVMPDGNGLQNLPKITEKRPDLPVIIISAQNTIMTAIQATEANAFDYLPKPFDLPDLMKRAAKALDLSHRTQTPQVLDAAQTAASQEHLPLVGRTPAMQAIYRLVARIINTNLPVLITGESGTGKSLIARAIHDFSDRRTMPFIRIDAQDLTGADGAQNMLQRAKGGTILFDEVGDFDDETQAKIVRMLDAMPDMAPRIMAASQQDLTQKMHEGGFRQDLFYRLNGVTVALPPLRERVDDIALLCTHFLARAEHDGGQARRFAKDALDAFRTYSWPGNVRQLENTIRHLTAIGQTVDITGPEAQLVLGQQPAIDATIGQGDEGKLSAAVAQHLKRYFDLHGGALPAPGLYGRILREIEAPLIEIALDATGGNQAKCADLLGLNRNTLRKKITDLDIQVTRRRKLM
jgi:two-component system nitrogen regulation response regulator GlnG